MKETISFNDFDKLDMVVGKIKSAEKIAESDKLIKLIVDIGNEIQLVAGIAHCYSEKELEGKNIVVLTNLEPRKIRGLESKGMLLAADDDTGKPVLLTIDRNVPAGTKIR